MPFKAYYLDTKGTLSRDLDEEEIRSAFESKQGLLWVDITETTEEDGDFLERCFKFHHLAIEDCVSPKIHSPKIDDLGDYLFIIIPRPHPYLIIGSPSYAGFISKSIY